MFSKKGFTLIEIIACLILVGIISAIAGMGIVEIVNGYRFAKKNAETVQKARFAMFRLVKELKNSGIISALPDSVKFLRDAKTYTVKQNGSLLVINDTINDDALCNDVVSFNLYYYDSYNSASGSYSAFTSLIGIALKLKEAEDIVSSFETRVCIKK